MNIAEPDDGALGLAEATHDRADHPGLQAAHDEVIDLVKASGLRGRGGGGFPTGRKWQSCRASESGTKYVLCNADEGDPGAFMDRSALEGDPHSVLEGMMVAAYAIGVILAATTVPAFGIPPRSGVHGFADATSSSTP